MQWSSSVEVNMFLNATTATSFRARFPAKKQVGAQMHRAIYNILLPRTGWHLIPFPPPQRVYGRMLRHNQIFSGGWFIKFYYPWCSTKIQGKSTSVRVSKGSSNQESTVFVINYHKNWMYLYCIPKHLDPLTLWVSMFIAHLGSSMTQSLCCNKGVCTRCQE